MGCVLVGIGSLFRGDYSLAICLPAGLALIVLPTILVSLDRRWYPRIIAFELDESNLIFKFTEGRAGRAQQISDVCWVEHKMSKAGKTRGYRVKFQDGSGIYFCRSLSNADELARVLKESTRNRVKPLKAWLW